MLQSLVLLENVTDPESVMSLNNCSLPSSSQQLQQKKKLPWDDAKSFGVYQNHLMFSSLFLRCHEIMLGKIESQTQSQKVTVFAIGHCKLFVTLCAYTETRQGRTRKEFHYNKFCWRTCLSYFEYFKELLGPSLRE